MYKKKTKLTGKYKMVGSQIDLVVLKHEDDLMLY